MEVTTDTVHLVGKYDSLDAALAAAERIADESTGELHLMANVLVVATSGRDREVVDGVYPGGGGRR